MMGNYSLLDAISPVEMTPLGQDILRDPRAASRMATDLSGMSAYQPQGGVLLPAEPAGNVTGQHGSEFYSATPEDDTNTALDIFKTIVGAPFNILKGAKEGLEDAIGHPYAAQRDAQDQYILAMSALRDPQKAQLGMPVDRMAINDRQTNPSTVATGTVGGQSTGMSPVRSWLPDLITGEKRKRRQRELADIEANLKAQGINLNLQSLQAGIYKDVGAGTNSFASANKTDLETAQLARYGDADWRAKIDAQVANAEQSRAAAGASGALAGKYGAEAGLANARTGQVNALTPAQVYSEYARGNRSQAAADRDWALIDPQVAKERTAAIKNMAGASASAAKEVATGRPSVLQAASALNAANTSEEKSTTAAGLGINMKPKGGVAGFFGGKEPDLAEYASRIAGSAPQKSAADRLQELIAAVDAMQRGVSDASAPPVQAQPDNATLGNEASTQASAAPGQVPMTSGEVEEVFREYGRSPKAIDAAYRAGLISESSARKALEVLGYQRMR